jgi:hypothetical protein
MQARFTRRLPKERSCEIRGMATLEPGVEGSRGAIRIAAGEGESIMPGEGTDCWSEASEGVRG